MSSLKTKNRGLWAAAAAFLGILLLAWGLQGALLPFFMAFVLAYWVFPWIQALENQGIPRQVSSIAFFFGIAILGTFLFVKGLPKLVSESKELLELLPQKMTLVLEKLEVMAYERGIDFSTEFKSAQGQIQSSIQEVSTTLIHSIGGILKAGLQGVHSLLGGLMSFFLIPIFFFYILNEYETIRREIRSWFSREMVSKMSPLLERIRSVLQGYFRGQLLACVVLALLYSLGLTIVGLKFGWMIGLVTGLLTLIPYVGVTVGLLCSMILLASDFPGYPQALGVLGVFAVMQVIEGLIVTPKLVGDKVGLSSLGTLVALLIGSNIAGIFGMLVAIPVAAIAKILYLELKKTLT